MKYLLIFVLLLVVGLIACEEEETTEVKLGDIQVSFEYAAGCPEQWVKVYVEGESNPVTLVKSGEKKAIYLDSGVLYHIPLEFSNGEYILDKYIKLNNRDTVLSFYYECY